VSTTLAFLGKKTRKKFYSQSVILVNLFHYCLYWAAFAVQYTNVGTCNLYTQLRFLINIVQVENVAIANALQLEAARATPALSALITTICQV